MWLKSVKEHCTVYKMSALGAQEVFLSSWKFNQTERFHLQKCIPGVLFQDENKMINLKGDNIEVVDRFSYLGDELSSERTA